MAFADPGWLIALKIAAVLGLVLLNGFFVAAEFAIVKVRETQIETALRKGDKRAKRSQHVVEHLDAYLSATQLGITLASIGLGFLGEPAVATLIEPLLVSMGVTSAAAIHGIAFVVAFAIITFLHIVLGELAPKSLAIQRSLGVTLWATRPLHLFYLIFKPAIWALNGTANAMLRGFGVRPASEAERAHSEEELRLLLTESRGTKTRKDLILNAMDLRRRLVRQIMVPRPFVVPLSTEDPLQQNFRVAREAGYTRYPLVKRDLDRIVGMVHFKDLAALAAQASDAPIEVIRRDVLVVPDSVTAEDLLTRFLQRHEHLAVVMDEFGSTVGIVTLEDVLEELVGPIQDEFDSESPTVRRVDEGRWIAEGHAALHELDPLIGPLPPNPDVTTVGGYVTAALGRIPQQGERVRVKGFDLVVRGVDRRRVRSVEIVKRAPAKDED